VELAMKKIKVFTVLSFFLLLMGLEPGLAGTKHYSLVNGEENFYFGFISYIPKDIGSKPPEIIRPGLAAPEKGTINFPLGPGDEVVIYDMPCEIQFDSGTIVRLDVNTRLKIETIMAQTLSSSKQLSNLYLERGNIYLMYTAYNSWEIFQLLSPTTAMKMKNHTVALVSVAENGETKLAVKEGKINLLYGPESEKLESVSVKKGDCLMITADHKPQKREGFAELSDFEVWNVEINKDFLELHKGFTPLPKPIQKLPRAVFHFAQFYSSVYGEWLWDEYYGYVWRPFYNDVYPWGNWSPYVYGRWTYLNGSLFWVPEEPWGWVPYHLGIWQWDEKHGWVWIPGSMFAPAWAVWDFYFGYYSWKPLTLMGFWLYWDPLYYHYTGYYIPGYGSAGGQTGGNPDSRKVLTEIRKNQLKKPQAGALAIPGEYKSILKNLDRAIEKGDPEVLKRISIKPPEPVMIRREDIAAGNLAARRVAGGEILERLKQDSANEGKGSRETGMALAQKLAVYEFLRDRRLAAASKPAEKIDQGSRVKIRENLIALTPGSLVERGMEPKSENLIPVRRPSAVSMRFRDWNPDIKVAKELGVHVVYDSTRNSIISPELRFTSREARETRIRLTSGGFVQTGPASGPHSGYISSSSSSSSSSASQGKVASPERGSAPSSSHQSGSGRIKEH